ncbi:hypothetical protein HU200_044846 [Digitaria exilis]|uniref:Uncharacterized protein n=1 Tax=Digitaria exilis TaxID=1010633 RepID=A0A835EFF0_9POAL|nr:hypothetical protein HU200_044846 [Digitaria exilis]
MTSAIKDFKVHFTPHVTSDPPVRVNGAAELPSASCFPTRGSPFCSWLHNPSARSLGYHSITPRLSTPALPPLLRFPGPDACFPSPKSHPNCASSSCAMAVVLLIVEAAAMLLAVEAAAMLVKTLMWSPRRGWRWQPCCKMWRPSSASGSSLAVTREAFGYVTMWFLADDTHGEPNVTDDSMVLALEEHPRRDRITDHGQPLLLCRSAMAELDLAHDALPRARHTKFLCRMMSWPVMHVAAGGSCSSQTVMVAVPVVLLASMAVPPVVVALLYLENDVWSDSEVRRRSDMTAPAHEASSNALGSALARPVPPLQATLSDAPERLVPVFTAVGRIYEMIFVAFAALLVASRLLATQLLEALSTAAGPPRAETARCSSDTPPDVERGGGVCQRPPAPATDRMAGLEQPRTVGSRAYRGAHPALRSPRRDARPLYRAGSHRLGVVSVYRGHRLSSPSVVLLAQQRKATSIDKESRGGDEGEGSEEPTAKREQRKKGNQTNPHKIKGKSNIQQATTETEQSRRRRDQGERKRRRPDELLSAVEEPNPPDAEERRGRSEVDPSCHDHFFLHHGHFSFELAQTTMATTPHLRQIHFTHGTTSSSAPSTAKCWAQPSSTLAGIVDLAASNPPLVRRRRRLGVDEAEQGVLGPAGGRDGSTSGSAEKGAMGALSEWAGAGGDGEESFGGDGADGAEKKAAAIEDERGKEEELRPNRRRPPWKVEGEGEKRLRATTLRRKEAGADGRRCRKLAGEQREPTKKKPNREESDTRGRRGDPVELRRFCGRRPWREEALQSSLLTSAAARATREAAVDIFVRNSVSSIEKRCGVEQQHQRGASSSWIGGAAASIAVRVREKFIGRAEFTEEGRKKKTMQKGKRVGLQYQTRGHAH